MYFVEGFALFEIALFAHSIVKVLSKWPTINYLIERPLTQSPFANSANLFANGHFIVILNHARIRNHRHPATTR
jgi:hypothetical protein